MATTRIKDISKTTTDLASDTYGVFDGSTNGTQKMARNDMYADWAAAYVAAPTTYKLAPLNSGTNKIDATYLPTSGDTPKGEWNANTNSPALADGSGTAGDYYDVTTAGTQDLGSGSIAYTVGDVVKYNGSTWFKIDSVANILDGSATAADGRSTLSVNSIDEDAQANALKTTAPALYFDGSSSVVTVADDDKLSFTDGVDDLPFSVSAWVKADDLSNFSIAGKYGTSNATREFFVGFNSSDRLEVDVRDTSGNTAYLLADAAETREGQWIHVAATYAGAGPNSNNAFTAAADGLRLYINDIAVTATASNNASYTGMSDTTQAFWIGRQNNAYANGSIRDVKIFNRELTSTEIAELARGNDLGFSDEWGDHTASIYSGDSADFASSLGNWTEYGSTSVTVAQAGGVAQITNTAASTGARGLKNSVDTITEGKRYRMEFTSRVSSGTGQEVRIRSFNWGAFGEISNVVNGAATANFFRWTPTGSTTKHSFEFVTQGGGSTDYLIFDLADNTGAGEVYDIDDVKVVPIGTLADFRAEDYNESASKLLDRSSNNFVGVGTSVTLTGNQRHISADTIDLKNLPTSSAGLSAGEVWSNSGVLTVV
jgi:hypothetical protein